jgi:hypothetical protein
MDKQILSLSFWIGINTSFIVYSIKIKKWKSIFAHLTLNSNHSLKWIISHYVLILVYEIVCVCVTKIKHIMYNVQNYDVLIRGFCGQYHTTNSKITCHSRGPVFTSGVLVAHRFSFLSCVFCSLCLRPVSCVRNITLSISLDCPLFIAPWVFSNVY